MRVRGSLFPLIMMFAFAGVAMAQAPQKYLVSFRPGTSQAQRADAARGAGVTVRFSYSIVDAAAITVPNPNALAALSQNPAVVRIVPDRPIQAFQSPAEQGDIHSNAKPGGTGGGGGGGQVTPEGVKRVGVPTVTSNGAGIGIAILDTGIDADHPDLAHPPVVRSFSAFLSEPTCDDLHGHGTHVAGIAAALDNTVGVIGVAPAATPYCVKVLDRTGSGSDSDIIAGLNQVFDWNSDNNFSPKIKVINMSLGRDKFAEDDNLDSPLHLAIQKLYASGVVIVVAAGNNPAKEVKDMIPAGFREVFAVASTTAKAGTAGRCGGQRQSIPADTASSFTTDGRLDGSGIGVTISAPGEDSEDLNGCLISSAGILSTAVGSGTTRKSGTSMASPHVAGVVARWIQNNPTQALSDGTGVEAVRAAIRSSASGLPTAPLPSPTSIYSSDGEREGIAKAP